MNGATRALTLLSIALLTTVAVAGAATAAEPETIRDGNEITQGYEVQTEALFNASESVTLYTASGDYVVTLSADGDGSVAFDTDSMSGEYYLERNETKALNFSVRPVEMEASFEGAEMSDGGDVKTARVTISLNAANEEVAILSDDIPNLAERTTGAGQQNGQFVATTNSTGTIVLKIDISNLDSGSYQVTAETTSPSTGSASTSIEIGSEDDSSKDDTASSTNPVTKQITDGGQYWAGHRLTWSYGDGRKFEVRTGDGEYVYSGTGTFEFDTSPEDAGQYVVTNASTSGGEVATFGVREQTMSANVENWTLTVTSNRDGYDLTMWADGLDRSQLLELVPAASTTDSGNVVIRDAPTILSADLAVDSVPAGSYSLHISAKDTAANATATVDVLAESTPTTTASSSANPEDMYMATPTETATATATTSASTTTSTTVANASATTDGNGLSTSETDAAGVSIATLGGAALALRRKGYL